MSIIEYPCCGSYTTIIDQYVYNSKTQSIEKNESTALINNRYFKSTPVFDHLPTKKASHFSMYGSPSDFRGSSPYFGVNGDILNDSLRLNEFIHLMTIPLEVEFSILGHITHNSGEYYLIRTEKISPEIHSKYEWPKNQSRHYIGWVKKEEIETP